MLLLALACLVVSGAVAASTWRLRTIQRFALHDPETIAGRLERAAEGGRLNTDLVRKIRDELAADAPSRELLDAVLIASSRQDAVALVNLALSEIGHELSRGADVPKSAARICVMATGAMAVIDIGLSLQQQQGLGAALTVMGLGACGGVACGLVGQRAAGLRKVRAASYNRLTRSLHNCMPGDGASDDDLLELIRAADSHLAEKHE